MRSDSSIFIPLTIFLIPPVILSSSPRTLKLCLYLKAIGRSSIECDFNNGILVEQDLSGFTTMSPLAKIIQNIEKKAEKLRLKMVRIPICKTDDEFKRCRPEMECSSGYSCENSNGARCCLLENRNPNQNLSEGHSSCPSLLQMSDFCGPSKIARKLAKRCSKDVECLLSNVQKCCDTGCGFGVCLIAPGSISRNTLIFLGRKNAKRS